MSNKTIPYTYAILRYVHDPVAGEKINIGVLMCAEQNKPPHFLLHDESSWFLTRIFKNFDSVSCEGYLDNLEQAFHVIRKVQPSMSANEMAKHLIPDDNLSYQFSNVGAGLTDNVAKEAAALFERFVTRGRP